MKERELRDRATCVVCRNKIGASTDRRELTRLRRTGSGKSGPRSLPGASHAAAPMFRKSDSYRKRARQSQMPAAGVYLSVSDAWRASSRQKLTLSEIQRRESRFYNNVMHDAPFGV